MSRRMWKYLLATAAILPIGIGPVAGNPLGPQVVGGAATVQGPGTPSVTVTQSTGNAIINWQSFNIGSGEQVSFVQPNASSVVLNRVTGVASPSVINGSLTANGRVFLVNPDGILFGAGAVIDTAGFLATTSDIRNSDFMAGRYRFNIGGRPDASIVNYGTITATGGGFAALVAPGVRNSGTITATLGTVALVAGNSFTLDFYGDRLIMLGVDDQIASTVTDVATGRPLRSLVGNDGTLSANGGRVELTAAAARRVVDSVINNSGVIEANSIGTRNRMIVLSAATKTAGLPKQTIKISGTISAAGRNSGERGGTIEVTGQNIRIAGATIDASGAAGGGTVLIGGGPPRTGGPALASTVVIGRDTRIDADATQAGDGGRIVVWADRRTSARGIMSARGGLAGGNGGSVETAGRTVDFSGLRVDTLASLGRSGTWLVDASRLTVGAAAAATISENLATTSVMLQTSTRRTGTEDPGRGDIIVAAPISWSSGNTLTLSAFRDITVNSGATIASTGPGNLVLRADNTGTGTGSVHLGAELGSVDFSRSTGTVSIYYDPRGENKYENPVIYGTDAVVTNPAVARQLTAYMLINNVDDLRRVGSSSQTLAGTYALGTDIDATKFRGFGTGSTFTGLLDGNGGIGRDYTISNLTLSSSSSPVGLFGFIGATGTVRNLNLANVSATATGGPALIGTLAGENDGTILNVSVTGTVNGAASLSGILAGGLVGRNDGTIMQSSAAVNVSVGNAGGLGTIAGGLAGANVGTISRSQASGTVTGGSDSVVGGLVGQNVGGITTSFATGNVSGSTAGGLVGVNAIVANESESFSQSSITWSYATGNVSGQWAGGLVAKNSGLIFQTFATGAVSGGPDSIVGGLVAMNFATIDQSFASGAVTSGDRGIAGGLVGLNGSASIPVSVDGPPRTQPATGSIGNADATGRVTGGANGTFGGLVGQNGGAIDRAYAAGRVVAGPGSTTGGLVAAPQRALGPGGQAGDWLGRPLVLSGAAGTVTSSYWDIRSTGQPASAGGTGLTTAQLTAALPAGFDPGIWTINPAQSYPYLLFASNVPVPPDQTPPPTPTPTPTPTNTPAPVITTPTLVDTAQTQFAAKFADQNSGTTTVIDLTLGPTTGAAGNSATSRRNRTRRTQPGVPNQPPGIGDPNFTGAPPLNETRFVSDEVMIQLGAAVSPDQLRTIAQRFGLSIIASEELSIVGRTVVRLRITSGQSVRDVIRALEAARLPVIVTPNYQFALVQDAAEPAESTGSLTSAQPVQYVVDKLHLARAHRLSKGDDILIAMIDSGVDAEHPDLRGAVVERFDEPGTDIHAHPHGTGMAGAIASHRQLLGVAPNAKLLTIRAFAPGTTDLILKGVDWAVGKGARIVNMSFAGPFDPMLQEVLKRARARGVLLVAAAGNAGPTSPPLYPGADPNVIAVTATDGDDNLFGQANRGRQVSIAAPGVDVLVPAPDAAYQLTTGTSVATAHVSGVAALMMARNPKADAETIREILLSTARDLGPKGRDDQFGWGLVDPVKALTTLDAQAASVQ